MINKNLLKTLGPGIMFAGTGIGGSHLVQSTRAGANFGFELLIIILAANLFKYPFFEFASRYTNATGQSILEGFKKEGKWTLYLYGAITFFSMFVVTAAILFVTGGLLANLFQADPDQVIYWTLGLSVLVWGLLSLGNFNFLDAAIKVIGVILVLSVVGATVAVLLKGRPGPVEVFIPESAFTLTHFGFLIGLMGWMPMGVDMSTWGSLWTEERIKQTGYHPKLKETLLDFNLGYGITVFLALCFLSLGAYVFYGSGEELSTNAVTFSSQLVSLFTKNIGQWSYLIIAAAAFSTMFGTSLTLVDGYKRSIIRIIELLKDKKEEENQKKHIIWSFIIILGGFLIIYFGTHLKGADGKGLINFKTLIDIATATSFVVAPLAAWLNYKIIFNKNFPATHKPSNLLKYLAISGIALLTIFTMSYLLNLGGWLEPFI
jgi:Mn2+/Fe2+ NRAMP family transporter